MGDQAAGEAHRPVVLLDDDDAGIRRTVGIGLELEGFKVVGASGGRAALAAVPSVRPAVILLDLAMPDLDGLEVLRTLRGAATTCRSACCRPGTRWTTGCAASRPAPTTTW